jgi:hypothetical protein
MALAEQIQSKLFRLRRAAQTIFRRAQNQSDVARWRDDANLNASWDTRTAMLATMIAPGSAVLEFGAGRIVLPRYLPANCTYTPSDLVDRGQGTIVCDLNAATLPPFPGFQVAVFSGVLEYVNDLPRLLAHLARDFETIVASYAVADFLNQCTALSRRAHGWVNDFNSREIEELFLRAGFQCAEKSAWTTQHLFRFTRVAR